LDVDALFDDVACDVVLAVVDDDEDELDEVLILVLLVSDGTYCSPGFVFVFVVVLFELFIAALKSVSLLHEAAGGGLSTPIPTPPPPPSPSLFVVLLFVLLLFVVVVVDESLLLLLVPPQPLLLSLLFKSVSFIIGPSVDELLLVVVTDVNDATAFDMFFKI